MLDSNQSSTKNLWYNSLNAKKLYIKNHSSWMFKLLTLDGDVEKNPGPEEITMVTLKCRGLKNEGKIKQLLNRLTTTHNIYSNLIITLQETHLNYNSLKYRWKGNHIFTPSIGAKGGVVTLLSDNISILKELHIGNESHVALLKVLNGAFSTSLIVANIHSPCAHNNVKIKYFETLSENIDKLLEIDNDAHVIIMGDFNTTFNSGERIHTEWSNAEKRSALQIKHILDNFSLTDCWANQSSTMTWRHGDKMSKIDRILFATSLDMQVDTLRTDWSYTDSDHSAVILKLKSKIKVARPRQNRVVQIDVRFMQNTLLKHNFLQEIKRQADQLIDSKMNPHQQLEFLKMAIRSTALEIASNQKRTGKTYIRDKK